MTEPCDHCQRAADPATHPRQVVDFTGGCLSCAARAIVAMGFHERPNCSLRTFGDQLEEGRAEIRRWAAIFRQSDATQGAKHAHAAR